MKLGFGLGDRYLGEDLKLNSMKVKRSDQSRRTSGQWLHNDLKILTLAIYIASGRGKASKQWIQVSGTQEWILDYMYT